MRTPAREHSWIMLVIEEHLCGIFRSVIHSCSNIRSNLDNPDFAKVGAAKDVNQEGHDRERVVQARCKRLPTLKMSARTPVACQQTVLTKLDRGGDSFN